MNMVFVGCGSEDDPIADAPDGEAEGSTNPPETGPVDMDSGDAFIDMILDGSRADASACTATGATCTKSTECCTANCNASTGKCEAPNTVCGLPTTACTTGNQCCTGSCVGGTCSNLQCVADNGACGVSGECCSGQCAPNGTGGGVCKPLGPKPTSGNPCTMNSQCATGWCNNGVCANPSFCTVTGDICSTDAQCCGGLCSKAAGSAVGVCKSVTAAGGVVGGPCLAAGEICSPNGTCTGASCCSRSCAPSPTSGIGVCQPESGCHIIGDLCTTTSECCGVKDLPGSIKGAGGPSTDVQCQKAAGQTYGVCNYVSTVCSPAGAICKPGNATTSGAMSCSTKVDCCAGNTNQLPTCQIDTNGIPRCTVKDNLNCDAGAVAAGTQCASSADCCGSACIPNADPGTMATKPYVCATSGTCQKQGATCTSNGDCCMGLPCAIPPGAASGICGGTLLPDGGVSTTPPPGTDGGVITAPDSGTTDGGTPTTCSLYGQACTTNASCCSGVPCTGAAGRATCHYP
jgi:hypothetical protein